MKLRARKRSVLDNIKQEDCNFSTLTNAHSSAIRATESTKTVNLIIKQEETKEHKSLLKKDDNLDKKEFRYQCDFCKIKMANLTSVLEHRTSTHGIRLFGKRTLKNLDKEPDVNDPNFYCKTCERGYNNTSEYRRHLRLAHYMILKPMSKWKAKNGIAPDPNDPSLYCRACEFTYKYKSGYKQHCRYAHGVKLAEFANPRSTSSSLTDSYCHICDVRLSSIRSYRRHLLLIHKINSRSIQQKRSDIMPNVNDPNFYCRSCEKKSASKDSFRIHLMTVHSIFKSAPKKSILKPDVDDPNNYCRACQKAYIFKGKYRLHLRTVHQMTLIPLKGNDSLGHLPDPYNPDYYCSVCKKTYASVGNYRMHCKLTHLMELGHYTIVNPTAPIDVNHPNYYCAQCEHTYHSKQSFQNHLRKVHFI